MVSPVMKLKPLVFFPPFLLCVIAVVLSFNNPEA
ncbi:unnamed protein product, partial [marine sediment metagenome]